MAIVRWDPWKELAGLERQFDELIGRFGRGSGRSTGAWAPALDVHQDGDTMVIRAEVAGVSPDQIEITLDDDVLTISGTREEDRTVQEGQWIRRERLSGQFRRSVNLPPGVDPEQISATAENGVIEIRVPRPRPTEPRRIQLQGGEGGRGSIDVTSGSSGQQQRGEQQGGEQQQGGKQQQSDLPQ